ncbi:MAG: macro domain-containing protein [Thermoplasmata archaeon]|nr:MAG: macro domain-containing protein [Thermoplasmata archaeon]
MIMEKKFNDVIVRVVEGDITEQGTDAIVNAANNELWMGAGVAGAIKRKGGVEIELEAVAKGPIPIGEAAITGGGKLKARYVIHAAGMGRDLRTDEGKIRATTTNSLKRADEKSLKSIAFPSIGTGVGGFPLEKAAEVMIGAVKSYIEEGKSGLELVVFVLWGEEAYKAFEKVLKNL